MIVVKIELWPGGSKEDKRLLGTLIITNNGTGSGNFGNYDVTASHSGKFVGKRKEPYKTGKVTKFLRSLSPYRLLYRALHSIGEV